MMAIASPSAPSFSASFCCKARTESTGFPRFSTTALTLSQFSQPLRLTRRLTTGSTTITSLLKPSGAGSSGGSVSPDNGDVQHEFHHGLSTQRWRRGLPVFVTLPLDVVGPTADQVRRRKTMVQSIRALWAAGVEGVVIEVWWGLVERDQPGVYDWRGYLEIVAMARQWGLKVRAVMAFHQCNKGPGDPNWIPLPRWVLEEIDKDPDLVYSDRLGTRNMEYISLGCDTLPVLRGRSPIQAYADFMRNFRDTFKPFLGVLITGIQVGMGPAGELRYPSCPSWKLTWDWRSRELGEFQCYDKYMLASLNACAQEIGMPEWGGRGPIGAFDSRHNLEKTEFFRSADGSWNTPYGKFFLEWYSGMLLLHGERICREAEAIFHGTEVATSAKVAGIHWHYNTQSHPSELTCGYYNTSTRDGYLPIARMFGRYGFTLRCPCFEMKDVDEKRLNPVSSPEGLLRQLLLAVRVCDIPLEGENAAAILDDDSFQQVLKIAKLYSDGLEKPSFSFNFMRMDKNMFDPQNWIRFTRFVRQMSDANIFQAKLDIGGGKRQSSTSEAAKVGMAFAYC